MRLFFLCLIFAALTPSMNAGGEEVDAASATALQQTQEMLKDRNKRNEAVQKDQRAKEWNQAIQQFAGSESRADEIYGIASDVFADLVKETGGDVSKMMELVEKAKKDPNAFGAKLTPEQRQRIKALADKIDGEPKHKGLPPQAN